MEKKEEIKELLNAYKSEVDNFNDDVFSDKFEVLAQDIVKLFAIPVVVNCKHDDYTPCYGREGELMFKQCNICGEEFD